MRRRLGLVLVALLLAGGAAAVAWFRARPAPPAPVPVADTSTVAEIALPDLGLPLPPGTAATSRVTRQEGPDGSTTVALLTASGQPAAVVAFYQRHLPGARRQAGASPGEAVFTQTTAQGLDTIHVSPAAGGTRIFVVRTQRPR